VTRLIDLRPVAELPPTLAVRVGDVLLIGATGGRVRAGRRAAELWGPFVPADLTTAGAVLAPAGSPSTVVVRARRPGSATLVLTVDPLHPDRPDTR
jgi:hypothetical protein